VQVKKTAAASPELLLLIGGFQEEFPEVIEITSRNPLRI
jgi:hypothetical protein